MTALRPFGQSDLVDDAGLPSADKSVWRGNLVPAALVIGLAVLAWGFATTQSLWVPTHTASLQRMLAGVAIALAVGAAATVATKWAKQFFVFAGLALAVLGFGWIPAAVGTFAFLAFAVVGETILPSNDVYDTVSVQGSIGAGCYLLLFGVLVHFPVNTPLVYGALLAAPFFNLPATRVVVGRLGRWLSDKTPSRAGIAAATVLFAVVIVNASGAAMPEAEFDALNQHLFVGQEVARLGFWPFDVKDFVLAVMPMGTDWLFGLGNMLGDEPAAKTMAVLLFLIASASVFTASRRLGADSRAAMLLAALYGSTPITVTETYTLFIENGLAIFFLCGFSVLFCYPAPAHRRTIAAAINVGAMLATKALAVFLAGPFGLGALFLLRRCRGKQRLWAVALGGVALVLGFLPYIDAALITRNPVFPFFNGIFHSPFYEMANFRTPYPKGDWLPLNLFYGATFHSAKYGAGMMDGAFGFAITALFLAAAAAAIVTRSWVAFAALACGTFYMFAVANSVQLGIRYFYPGLPLIVVGLAVLFCRAVLPRAVCVGIVVPLIAVNFYYYDRAYEPLTVFSWDWLLSPTRWTDMGQMRIPERIPRSMIRFRVLNQRADADGLSSPRVLTSINVKTDLAGTLLCADWMAPELDNRILHLKSVEDFQRLVRDFGVTHAIVDVTNLQNKMDTSYVAENAKFGSYVAELGTPIAEEGGWVLYRLPPNLWLGQDLISHGTYSTTSAVGKERSWQIDGIQIDRLYRVQMDVVCKAPGDRFSINVDFETNGQTLGGKSRQIFCGHAGKMTRLLDVVPPWHSDRAVVHFSTDSSGGRATAISFRQGYQIDGAWRFRP